MMPLDNGQRRFLDILWLAILVIFILAGIPIATFHGDESMQIYASHDYATAFIYGAPERLTTDGYYEIDTDPHLRILNGSVNRYAIGLGWHLAGYTNGDLPPRPGWDWGLSYERNVETGHRPVDGLLAASRASSTVFLALSVIVLFGLGWQLCGRGLAWIASGLYAVNPILLLNGRRAMMEGSLLFFGLLTIFIAATISKKRAQGELGLWLWWLGLIISGGLAIVSKHSGVVYIVGALGWIFVADLLRRRWRDVLMTIVKLAASGAVMFAIFIALSPALWNNPQARLQDLLRVRGELIDIQVIADPDAPMPLAERIREIVTQPFMTPVAQFEVGGWSDFSVITAEIEHYMASPLSGVQFGNFIGGLLTVLAIVGMVSVIRQGLTWQIGLFVWLAATLAMLLVNPLPWQRYYLPLIPIVTLLASLPINTLLTQFVNRPEQEQA